MLMEEKMFRILVTGRVQGVGYRSFVASIARKHHVTGFVRNLPDGTVEVVASERNNEFLKELRQPPHGAVDRLETQEQEGGMFETFEIR